MCIRGGARWILGAVDVEGLKCTTAGTQITLGVRTVINTPVLHEQLLQSQRSSHDKDPGEVVPLFLSRNAYCSD